LQNFCRFFAELPVFDLYFLAEDFLAEARAEATEPRGHSTYRLLPNNLTMLPIMPDLEAVKATFG
jgi:hypothetical protein